MVAKDLADFSVLLDKTDFWSLQFAGKDGSSSSTPSSSNSNFKFYDDAISQDNLDQGRSYGSSTSTSLPPLVCTVCHNVALLAAMAS